jgi:predicted Rossmann fold nucleotide-binding protein DprA/Smf involved in DNA uptake
VIDISDDAKAAIVLTSRLGDPQRPALTALAWHRLVADLAGLGKTPADVFESRDGLDPDTSERVGTLIDDAGPALVDLEAQLSRGMWVLTVCDTGYPERLRRLGDVAPPVIFGAGEAAILTDGGVGVVGSRDVSPEGAEVATAIGAEAARLGLPVVSGAAKGVDTLAMNAGFTAGGRTVGVVADSLEQRIRRSEMIQALDTERICLVTLQHPSAGFSPASAYGRNKAIYGLADLTVVVASSEGEGGTWKGATEALRLGLPVTVWRGDGEGPGNAALEKAGARPITDPGDLGSADGRIEPKLQPGAALDPAVTHRRPTSRMDPPVCEQVESFRIDPVTAGQVRAAAPPALP